MIAGRAKPVKVAPGHEICAQGEPADCIWLLHEGAPSPLLLLFAHSISQSINQYIYDVLGTIWGPTDKSWLSSVNPYRYNLFPAYGTVSRVTTISHCPCATNAHDIELLVTHHSQPLWLWKHQRFSFPMTLFPLQSQLCQLLAPVASSILYLSVRALAKSIPCCVA